MFHSKRSRWFVLLTLALAVTLVLAACGGDDDKEDKKDGDKVELTESYSSEMFGLSFKYPAGWIVEEGDSTISIANSQETMDASKADDSEVKEGQFLMEILPPTPKDMMGLAADASSMDALNMMAGLFAEDEDMEAGEAKETKVGDREAARMSVKSSEDKGEGAFLIVDMGDGNMVMFMLAAREGELDKYEDTGIKIAESMAITAPAAE